MKMMLNVKYMSLTVLVLQTTAMVLILRYSRTVPQSGPRYLASTTILISEIIKIITCIFVLNFECGCELSNLRTILVQEIFKKPMETLKLIVPAFLYAIQNNLLFIALSILDAATYQVTYQVKILTTAIFSVIMLHKRLVNTQWLALLLLMIGVALVQMPSSESESKAQTPTSVSSKLLGLMVVLLACFTSAFSGVYFEKLVKSTPQSLWVRNLQLGIFSLLASSLIIIQDSNAIHNQGFFQGYDLTTWIVIFLQAFGGLVVSTVIKFADNILKGFATSVSIVLSTVFSYYLLDDFEPTNTFFIGATIVIVATLLYGYPGKKSDKYAPVAKSIGK